MADPEHLEILKQGVKAWNQWRSEHEDVRPDLHTADLRHAGLGRTLLSDADLGDARLGGADFRGAFLNDAGLSGADLSRADFSRAELCGADLAPWCNALICPEAARRTPFNVEYRETLFDAVRASTQHLIFVSGSHLMNFMTKGLGLDSELEPRLPRHAS
jgi:hypothetical protein